MDSNLNSAKIYISKAETQQFLAKYPNFDGRGLKLAVIDGGIDVSSPGLQKTSNGLPKIIDCMDFTGKGIVDTSLVKKLDGKNSLIALSRRELNIPAYWKNPTKKWHLGITSLKELFPVQNNGIETQKLNSTEEEFIDCIVWNNGNKWCSCLINSATAKNVTDAKVLCSFFHEEHEYCVLANKVTCCITIRKNGNELQICASTLSHGTEVCHVAASHCPNNQSRDGLAPGAQIYFMDVMKQEEEACYFADEKAISKCFELGVDIVNISLEYCGTVSSNMIQVMDEMQSKHGTIIVKITGNDGPSFLSVIDNLTDQTLYIGAVITPSMVEAIYDVKSNFPPLITTYSSRGPSRNDYSRRVTFVAPGVALVPTAQWVSQKPQIVQGTSYAAPNVSGAVACLLCALKANSIPYTSAMIKFALSNTAIPLINEDKLAAGEGIIQINSAFEFLKNFSKISSIKISHQISVEKSKLKGIVLIASEKISQKYCIEVKSIGIKKEANIPWILKLFSSTFNSEIKFPPSTKKGSFDVQIWTNSLRNGELYYMEIHGFHPSHIEAGSFFYLPITIIHPKTVPTNLYQNQITISSNIPSYDFLLSPIDSFKCSFEFSYANDKKWTVLQKEFIDQQLKKRNLFNYNHEYCNLSIYWIGELFGICFYDGVHGSGTKICEFKAHFY